MATEGPVIAGAGYIAGADLTSSQFKIVKFSADNTVVECAAITDKPCGVLQNAPRSGAAATVVVVGQCKVLASASISAGAVIGTTNAGKAVAIVAGSDTTQYVVGIVSTASGANNEILTAMVDCSAPARAA